MTSAYLLVREASNWCRDRGYDDWGELDSLEMGQLILRASEWIDQHFKFRGHPESPDQVRAWPRIDAYADDGHAFTGIPDQVIEAVMTLALAMMEGEDKAEEAIGFGRRIKQQKAGGIEVQYQDGQGNRQTRIMQLLAPLVVSRQKPFVYRG